jgi:hypothetical protein
VNPQPKAFVAELTDKVNRRWNETIDKTRFMDELERGKLKKETLQLFCKNWGSFVPVINASTPPRFTGIWGSSSRTWIS